MIFLVIPTGRNESLQNVLQPEFGTCHLGCRGLLGREAKGLLALLPTSGAAPGVWPRQGLGRANGAGRSKEQVLVKHPSYWSLRGHPQHLFIWDSFLPVSPFRTNTGLAAGQGSGFWRGFSGWEEVRSPCSGSCSGGFCCLPFWHLILVVGTAHWQLPPSAHLPSYVKN